MPGDTEPATFCWHKFLMLFLSYTNPDVANFTELFWKQNTW